MIDMTIHLGDVLIALGLAAGGWRMAITFRDEIRGLRQTVYGSKEPPVEGLVEASKRHDDAIGRFSFLGQSRKEAL